MAPKACGSFWENCNQKRRILDIKSKRTKSSLAQLTDSASYSSIRFHLGTYSYCNKQKLTSCILIIPNFVKFRDIIIYVAWWWEKYLSKRSQLKHTCSWHDKLIVSKSLSIFEKKKNRVMCILQTQSVTWFFVYFFYLHELESGSTYNKELYIMTCIRREK